MPVNKKPKTPKKTPPAQGKGGGRPWLLFVATIVLALLVIGLVFLAHRQEIAGMKESSQPPLAKKIEPAQPLISPQPSPERQPPAPRPDTKSAARRPQLAIVMDDLGRSLEFGQALLAVDVPVTFAILPGEAHATELAEWAYRQGREILIHLPMEPQGYPLMDPGNDALLIAMPAAEIRQRMGAFLHLVPHAVGANNHMGSRFTEDQAGMQAVLATMKEANLFFLDSRTSPHSLAFAEASQAQVPAAERDVFLDNVQDVEKIEVEIRHLLALAKERGQAIGICHPYPQTLEALQRTASELRQAGVDLVSVAQLVAD